MSFPVTITAADFSVEYPNIEGPYMYNGSVRIALCVKIVSDSSYVAAFTSTDGVTWTEQDSSNSPLIQNEGQWAKDIASWFTTCQSTLNPNRVFVIFEDSSELPTLTWFDASTLTWSIAALNEAPSPPDGFEPPMVCCYRQDNSQILLLVCGDKVTLGSLTHQIPSYIFFDEATLTWGTWTDCDYSDYSGANTNWDEFPTAVVYGGSGRCHAFYQQITTSGNDSHPSRVWQQSIESGGGLGTLQEITAAEFPIAPAELPLTFTAAAAGGTVWIAFSSVDGDYSQIEAGFGTSANPISFSLSSFSSGMASGGPDPTPSVAASSTTGYCFYKKWDGVGGDSVYFVYRVNSGAGWSSEVAVGNIPEATALSAFSRIQATYEQSGAVQYLAFMFGTPEYASVQLSPTA